MDLKIILSKVSQKEKDKYHIISLIWGISNMTQMNLSTKQKQAHRYREKICDCQGGWRVGSDELGSWDEQMKTITWRLDKQQGLIVEYREVYSIS